MEHFVFGFILFVILGVIIWKSTRKKEVVIQEDNVKKETEEVIEKIRAEREIKPAPVPSLEPVVDVEKEKIAEEVKKFETAVVEEAKEAAAELVKEVDQVIEEVKVQELRIKTEAIEAAVEKKNKKIAKATIRKPAAKKRTRK